MLRAALSLAICVAANSPAAAQTRQPNPITPPPLEQAVKAAADLPRLHSLLVSQHGSLILERYFNGRRSTSPANIKSASKSVVSALVGIAIDRKLIKDAKQPIAGYLPEYFSAPATAPKRGITIEDL